MVTLTYEQAAERKDQHYDGSVNRLRQRIIETYQASDLIEALKNPETSKVACDVLKPQSATLKRIITLTETLAYEIGTGLIEAIKVRNDHPVVSTIIQRLDFIRECCYDGHHNPSLVNDLLAKANDIRGISPEDQEALTEVLECQWIHDVK